MVSPDTLVALFDLLPDVVFFVKDDEGRYTHANTTLRKRLGMLHGAGLIGKTAAEVFPEPLGLRYMQQDLRVIHTGRPIIDELERHLFSQHAHGWCLTRKLPMVSAGMVVGVVGISRDLHAPAASGKGFEPLSEVLQHVRRNVGEKLSVQGMASMAQMSIAQLERHFKALFQVTPQQWLLAQRLDKAMKLVSTDASVASIANACGFTDQSAFTRAFRRHVGLPPREYRALFHRG